MNNKGFTLIELVGVIVLIAISKILAMICASPSPSEAIRDMTPIKLPSKDNKNFLEKNLEFLSLLSNIIFTSL